MKFRKIFPAILFFIFSFSSYGQITFEAGKQYVIMVRISNKAVSLAAFPTLLLKEYNSREEQHWKFEKNPDSTFTIINQAHGMALTSPDSISKAAFLFLTPVDHSIQQKWRIIKINDENIAIVSIYSNQAVDIMEGSHFNGTFVMQWLLSGENQYWQIINQHDDGYCVLKAQSNDKILTADYESMKNGANIYQWKYSGKDWQKWYIEPVGGNTFKIISVHSKKAMQVSIGLFTQTGNIEQSEYCGMPWQHWRIIPLKGGYQFQSVFSGKVLDNISMGILNGNNIIEFDNNEGENQIFTIDAVDKLNK